MKPVLSQKDGKRRIRVQTAIQPTLTFPDAPVKRKKPAKRKPAPKPAPKPTSDFEARLDALFSGRNAPKAKKKPAPRDTGTPSGPVYHIGVTRGSRHEDTLITLSRLRQSGYNVKAYLLGNPSQAASVRQLDGVIIGGGADIDPAMYGERNYGAGFIDTYRDRLEERVIMAALDAGTPLMGICRGAQLINVVMGGTLYQDTQMDLGIRHAPEHTLILDQALADLIPTMTVNSSHHQAIKTIGGGLEVLAYAPDGIVEALHRPGVLAVQFHPETLCADNAKWAPLFAWILGGFVFNSTARKTG